MRSAICCDCNPLPDCARQQSAFSADCSRFGNAGQITGFVPFGVDCPKYGESSLWVHVQDHVIGITSFATELGLVRPTEQAWRALRSPYLRPELPLTSCRTEDPSSAAGA